MTITWPSLRRLEHCAAMEAIRLVALPFVRTIVLGDLHRNRPEVTGIRAVAVAGDHLPCLVPSGIGHVPRFHRVRHDGPTRARTGMVPPPRATGRIVIAPRSTSRRHSTGVLLAAVNVAGTPCLVWLWGGRRP